MARHWNRMLAPALATTLALGACKRPDADAAKTTEDVVSIGPENVSIVQLQELSSGPIISGSLQPVNASQVRAQVGGSIVEMRVDKGQPVTRGQVLARVDDSAIRDSYLSARSSLTTAEQALAVARRNAERAEKLAAAGAIAERDLEQARWNAQSAQSQAADARARLALEEKQLAQTAIRAPMSGVIAEAQVNGGDVVQPGSALFTIVDPRSMRLEGSVPSDQLSSVKIGMPVTFEVRGYPGRTFLGTVTRINPVADPVTRQVPVIVSIPNAGGQLVGGLFAQGRVRSETHDALTAPLAAVEMTGASPTVTRIKKGKVERVEVGLGIRDDRTELIEITSGLEAGDTLLTGAARGITPGTPVRVQATDRTAATQQ